MKKYLIAIIVFVIIILVSFGGYYIYSNNNSQGNDVELLKAKANEEITYLDSTIISVMNKFNNINYANYKVVEKAMSTENQEGSSGGSSSSGSSNSSSSQSGGGGSEEGNRGQTQSNTQSITNIDLNYSSILVNPNKSTEWDYIKKEIEEMYSTWVTVLIDLNALNVNKDNLLQYTVNLDNITQALEKEDKKSALIELANLHNLLGSYISDYSNDRKMTNLVDTKSKLLYAYALAEDENKWNEIADNIKKAKDSYNNIINEQLQNSEKSISNINKAYVLLNEIEKSTEKKNKSIFYINYKNLMQELEIIGEE